METQYNYMASKYDAFMRSTPFRPYIEAYTFLDTLGDVAGLEVVDLATGTGTYARTLAGMGAERVVGIDISSEMIAMAQQAEAETDFGIEYAVANATEYQSDEPFDLAIAVYLLHYSATENILRSMCKNIANTLKPGGRFVTYQVNPHIANQPGYYEKYGLYIRTQPVYDNGEEFRVQLKVGDDFTPDITFYRWDKATLKSALMDAGFTSIKWIEPKLSPEWDGSQGDKDFFDDYLTTPHALVLDCKKAE